MLMYEKIQELKHEIGGTICAMECDEDYIPDPLYIERLRIAQNALQLAEDTLKPPYPIIRQERSNNMRLFP